MTDKYLDPEFQDLSPEQVENISLESTQSEAVSSHVATQLAPREYQYELYKKATEENIIAVLDTGTGKTLISVMLIKHMVMLENERTDSSKRRVGFFIVDRVPLVFQQASVIRANCDARIKELCGDMNVDAWKNEKWQAIWDNYDICVLTAQVFLDALRGGFLTLDRVNLMIFDECHHATKGHAFNLIMHEFYHRCDGHKPKIFGMTASPIFTSTKKMLQSISNLEANLDCRVYTAKSIRELNSAINKPFETEIFYSMRVIDELPLNPNSQATKEAKTKAYALASRNIEKRYPQTTLTTQVLFKIRGISGYDRCETACIYVSNQLGPWCADRLWKAMLFDAHKQGLYSSNNIYYPEHRLSAVQVQKLKEAYELCRDDAPLDPNTSDMSLFTPKAKVFIECLKNIVQSDRDKKDFCGIVFVDRRHTAIALKMLIESITVLKDHLRCGILIGHGTNTGGDLQMKYTDQNKVIAQFRKGELNLLLATNVAEEGLDIQACNYVIRFDIFKSLIAYIQSRGRARRKDSRYILMINQQNPKEVNMLQNVLVDEERMKEYCRMLPKERNLALQFDDEQWTSAEDVKEQTRQKYLKGAYCIPSTGALLTLSNSIALIYHYCATLPADNYCNFKPVFKMIDTFPDQLESQLIENRYLCKLTLPINSCLKQIEGYASTKDEAKAQVSLDACIALHKAGEIDDNLVPKSKKKRQVLTEIEETDEHGKQIGSRGRENFYEKTMPLFWKHSGLRHGQQPSSVLGPYYVSRFEISLTAAESSGIPFRPMCLLTQKPLPSVPNIALFDEHRPFQVHVRTQVEKFMFESQEQLKLLKEYMFSVMRCVTNKEFTCPGDEVVYMLAPLKSESSTTVLKMDWDEVSRAVANSSDYMGSDSLSAVKDTMVVDASDQSKRQYFVIDVQREMSPSSPVPSLSFKRGKKLREDGYATFAQYYQKNQQPWMQKTITDMHQPLLRVRRVLKSNPFSFTGEFAAKKKDKDPQSVIVWLVPELCKQCPMSASVYQTLQIVPLIMSQINAVLAIKDVMASLCLFKEVNADLLLEAYTASSAGRSTNYQRLEFFGDSALKFISTTCIFVLYPSSNEYELTEIRMRMISNKALFKSAVQLKLYHSICSQNLPSRLWRPPNFICASDSAEIAKTLHSHKLSDKTLADVIESTLGAAYLSRNSLQDALDTAHRLRVPIDTIERWPADLLQFLKHNNDTPGPDVHEVNVAHINAILGYTFRDPLFAVEALTHATVPYSSVPCYQRLEFLGDAVLDFCVTRYLYERYPSAAPGTLHDLRKSSVNNTILGVLCIQLGLHTHIRQFSDRLVSAITACVRSLAEATQKGDTEGEYWLNFHPPKVLSDVVESLIGAVLVDSGFDMLAVQGLFDKLVRPLLDTHVSIESMVVHPLGQLKHILQTEGCSRYETRNITTSTARNSSNSANTQKCVIFIHDKAFASGSGINTREARNMAAARACQRIQDHPYLLQSLCVCHNDI